MYSTIIMIIYNDLIQLFVVCLFFKDYIIKTTEYEFVSEFKFHKNKNLFEQVYFLQEKRVSMFQTNLFKF